MSTDMVDRAIWEAPVKDIFVTPSVYLTSGVEPGDYSPF